MRGQEAHEKMLMIISHQENENYNNEIPLNIDQKD